MLILREREREEQLSAKDTKPIVAAAADAAAQDQGRLLLMVLSEISIFIDFLQAVAPESKLHCALVRSNERIERNEQREP